MTAPKGPQAFEVIRGPLRNFQEIILYHFVPFVPIVQNYRSEYLKMNAPLSKYF